VFRRKSGFEACVVEDFSDSSGFRSYVRKDGPFSPYGLLPYCLCLVSGYDVGEE
jgi:hypothetical protein